MEFQEFINLFHEYKSAQKDLKVKTRQKSSKPHKLINNLELARSESFEYHGRTVSTYLGVMRRLGLKEDDTNKIKMFIFNQSKRGNIHVVQNRRAGHIRYFTQEEVEEIIKVFHERYLPRPNYLSRARTR